MVEIKNLKKCYGNKQALLGLDITIQKGEVVGLLGLNGAGKSTTMNIMTGCLSATEGTVLIDGIDIAREPLKAKKKIGYLPEIPPLYTDMKVLQYLEFIYELKKVKGNKKEHLLAVCEKVGITDVKGRLIKNLSKGYRQRVGLAQAFIGNPPILILDEPTVGLDPTQIIEIRNLIEEMGKERTVILSSHILSEIQAVCKRVIVIDRGQVVADDTPENLEAVLQNKNCCIAAVEGDPEIVEETLRKIENIKKVTKLHEIEAGVFEYEVLGNENTHIRRSMFFALASANLPLLATRSAKVSLEDVFLQLVGTEKKTGGEA